MAQINFFLLIQLGLSETQKWLAFLERHHIIIIFFLTFGFWSILPRTCTTTPQSIKNAVPWNGNTTWTGGKRALLLLRTTSRGFTLSQNVLLVCSSKGQNFLCLVFFPTNLSQMCQSMFAQHPLHAFCWNRGHRTNTCQQSYTEYLGFIDSGLRINEARLKRNQTVGEKIIITDKKNSLRTTNQSIWLPGPTFLILVLSVLAVPNQVT